ncbi:Ditrans,polycis-undecaprenyl-diphosphate synthase ((2E,6E)-farnesyl-diphosphate specific) [subsurface metagenome]
MKFPQHIAIVMDGNRRWAQQRGLPALEGHKAGLKSMRTTMEYLGNHHLKYLTVYGFSTENWNRAPDEVAGLFQLFTEVLNKETPELNKRGVRLRHLGRLDQLPPAAQLAINRAVELTKNNTGMTLNYAVNYGGRQEILDAVGRFIADEGAPPLQIDEASFSRHLYTDGIPDVDLLIRTGGDLRLSNFLIWQAAYAEYYFTPVLWPDFDEKELEKALLSYSQRQRRFGGD